MKCEAHAFGWTKCTNPAFYWIAKHSKGLCWRCYTNNYYITADGLLAHKETPPRIRKQGEIKL